MTGVEMKAGTKRASELRQNEQSTLHRASAVDPSGRPSTLSERESSPEFDQVSFDGALQESQERLHALFEGVETGLFIIDPETHTVVDANSVAARLTGTPRDKIIGSRCHQFICPAEEGRCPVTDLGQAVDNSERVLLAADGQSRAIIKTVRPVVMSGRRQLLESFVDITELKKTQDALKERTLYLHSLFDVTPFAVVVLDSERRIQMSNSAFERLFLYSPAESQGACLDSLIVPEGFVEESNQLNRQCHGYGRAESRARRRRKDNSLVEVRIIATRLDINGNSRGALVLYEDITHQALTENAVAERHRLANIVAEIGGVLTGSNNLQQGLQKCAEILTANMKVAFARVWTVNEAERVLDLQASAGMYTHIDGEHARVPVGRFKIGKIAESGEPHLSNQVLTDPLVGNPEWARREGMVAFAGYPLKINERVLGVVAAFARQTMTVAALQTFASVADNLAQFIDRKRAEESLRESEDRFRKAFESAPYGMSMVTSDGRFLHANGAFCSMLGYSARELQGTTWQELTHPDDVERSYALLSELGGSRSCPVELEKRYVHKSGRIVWCRLKMQPVRHAGGELSHFITQTEDITLRKQADEAQAFLASIVECSPDAIVGEALDGTLVSWNHGAEELYGYTAQEVLGKPISILVPRDRIDEMRRALEAAGQQGKIGRYETVRVRKDGTHVDVALTLSPVRHSSGRITGVATIAQDITQRKVREEQTRLRTAALESSANSIVITDSGGTILWVNPAFTRLTGYAAEEVLGQNPRLLKSGIHDAPFYRNLWATVLRGEVWHGEIVNRRKDGTLYDEEMTVTAVREADGSIRHFLAVKQDITERKRAAEELLFKNTLLETEQETTIDGILVVDRKGKRLQSNRRFAEIFAVPPELLNTDEDRLMLEHVRSQVEDPESFVARVAYLYEHDFEKSRDEIHFKDGRCVDRYTAPLRGQGGTYYGRVWYFSDITDRKRAEQALRENEQQYRELFENASEIIFTTDLGGRFTSLNRAGQQTLGFSQEEAAQTDIWRLITPDYVKVLEQDQVRMLAGEAHLTSEIDVAAKDGRRIRLEVRPRLIWQGDKPIGIQAIARDITGRDVAEMELRQAQKLESVGRLAAGIAHEINTPIQFVGDNICFLQNSFSSLQMLLDKFGKFRDAAAKGAVSPGLLREMVRTEEESDCAYLLEEIPRAIAQTMEGVDRVATIVRAMKEFAHPESREMAPADVNKALLSTITVARNEWKYVAEVETRFSDLPLVICNVGDLNQVFLNLLVNAAHAITDAHPTAGKGLIAIRTAAEEDTVHISISDTGAGIPEEIREKIFDPFFTTKEVGRGTGQGLAIARSVVVERHKGTLTFESEVGKGTTFHIRLPVRPGEPAMETKGQ